MPPNEYKRGTFIRGGLCPGRFVEEDEADYAVDHLIEAHGPSIAEINRRIEEAAKKIAILKAVVAKK